MRMCIEKITQIPHMSRIFPRFTQNRGRWTSQMTQILDHQRKMWENLGNKIEPCHYYTCWGRTRPAISRSIQINTVMPSRRNIRHADVIYNAPATYLCGEDERKHITS